MCSGVIFFRTAVRGAVCDSVPSWQLAQLLKYWATPVLSDSPCASPNEGARLQVSTARATAHERESIFTFFLLPGDYPRRTAAFTCRGRPSESPPISTCHV